MDGASLFIQAIAVVAVLIGFVMFVNAPSILSGMIEAKRDQAELERHQQAEIARKLAIAEAANAARQRGETFVPPADYDR